MRRLRKLAPILLAIPAASFAQNAFIVSDIRLEGLQRIAPNSIFGLLNVRVGDQITRNEVGNIIRDVYSSGDFENVEVLQDDSVLIIRVTELPTISEIELEGNKMLPTEALMENMEGAGIAVGQIFQPSIISGMELALQDEYIGQGLYNSSVEVEVEEQPRNRVALTMNIDEGKASKILHINIVGNEVYSDEELLDLFELRETHLTSFFKKDNRYSREKINGDLERLASYYMDRGYINFDVNSTQVSLSPDKSEVYITVNISEGETYTINDVQLAGDMADLESSFRLVTLMRQGDLFSQQLVTTSSEFMKEVLNNSGYFFAEVEGNTAINEEDKTVDVTFYVDPGSRTYVNRINFYGNTDTVDEVLRREMRQMEGAPASSNAMEASKVRLERLGYFSEVAYETRETPGVQDQIDVDFTVEEQLNGSIGGSIGYSQFQGLVLSANLQQNNFLGTGTRVGIGVNNSRFATSYNFNFFDPYYTIDGVSRGFSLSYVTSDYAEMGLASYSTNQLSGSISYGYLVSETQSINFNFGASIIELETNDLFSGTVKEIKTSPLLINGVDSYVIRPTINTEYIDPETGTVNAPADAILGSVYDLPDTAFNDTVGFIDRFGTKFTNFTFGVSWNESTLNRGIFPTAGRAKNASLEMSVPGSDLQYFKLRYFDEIYIPIRGDWIVHAKADLGYGDGYGDNSQLPFFLNFYAGGLGSIRGFETNTLGPRSTFPEQYQLSSATQLLRDSNGNIIIDNAGNAVADPNSPPAYQLEAARDAEGNIILDSTTGLPTFNERLSRTGFTGRRPDPFGGNIQTTGTLELLFPLPFMEDRSQVRSSFFVDAGNVFSSYCTQTQELLNNCSGFDLDGFRYSAGLAVTWLSGFGPLSFSVAQPFNASEIDETEIFQFTIGSGF